MVRSMRSALPTLRRPRMLCGSDVRLAAARDMGQTKDATAITALADALSDSDPAMQRRAVESLRALSKKDFGNDVSAWQQYAKGENPQLKEPTLAERFRKLF